MDGDYNQEGNVFNRLLQYASKLTEKKQLREQLCHRPIDPNTGRKFFRPRTGRKPQNDVSNSSHPGGKQDVCSVAEMKIYLVSDSICGTILSRVMWKEKTVKLERYQTDIPTNVHEVVINLVLCCTRNASSPPNTKFAM
jgi:hypothetical protein